MADNKADNPTPKPGDIKPVFGAGVQAGAPKQAASKDAPGEQYADPDNPRPDEMVAGGAFIQGKGEDAVVVDANGDVRNDMQVVDGKIVKKATPSDEK